MILITVYNVKNWHLYCKEDRTMVKIMNEKEKDNKPLKILLEDQIDLIDWSEPEKYNFRDTPMEVRKKLVPVFLDYQYEAYRREHWDRWRRRVSQNSYAMNTIGIDAQSFSMYKNGLRFPSMENADTFAAYYGDIFYDICGYTRRMPQDKMLYQLADVWSRLDDRMKAELLERANNFIDNKETTGEMAKAKAEA